MLSIVFHISGTIHYMIFRYPTHVQNGNFSRCFFFILIFQFVRGLYGQKRAQKEKIFCPPHSISQKWRINWFSFILHMCEMILFKRSFYFFQNYYFLDVSEVNGLKMPKKDKKPSVTFHISGTIFSCFTLSLLKLISSKFRQ